MMKKYLIFAIILCCFSLARGQYVPSSPQQFNDETWRVFDNNDPTKRMRFEVSGLTTDTTRTLTLSDVNMTLIDWTAATENLYTTGSGTFDTLDLTSTTTYDGITTHNAEFTIQNLKDAAATGFSFAANTGDIAFFAIYADGNAGSKTPYLYWEIEPAGRVSMRSDVAIDFMPSNDNSDYIRFQTVSNVPEITTLGACDLKITSNSGTIDFDDENLTTSNHIITTGGSPTETGKFLTGSAGYTVFAFSGGGFDIRAGSGGSSSQNALRVSSAKNFDFYAGNLTTTGSGRFDGGIGVGAEPGSSLLVNISDVLEINLSGNYDFKATLGEELITNGDFDDNSIWAFGTGWVYDSENKEADFQGGNGNLVHTFEPTIGRTYQVTYTIKNYVVGAIYFELGGQSGASRTTDGTYIESITATSEIALSIKSNDSANFSIDDVSVKEIGGNFSNVGTIGCGAINGLTLAAAADGFTVAGGTQSRILTVTGADITLDAATQTGWGTSLTHAGDNTQAHSDYLLNTSDQMDGNLTIIGTLTVGVDDTGHDVKFYGATSGRYLMWDESADLLRLIGKIDADLIISTGGPYSALDFAVESITTGSTTGEALYAGIGQDANPALGFMTTDLSGIQGNIKGAGTLTNGAVITQGTHTWKAVVARCSNADAANKPTGGTFNLYGLYVYGAPTNYDSATMTYRAIYVAGGEVYLAGELHLDGDLNHDGSNVGFYGTAPIAKPTGVAVTAAGIHAALVSLGLIAP